MEKWKEDYLLHISQMSNEEVLDEYSGLCGGDDYDGCFTQRGEWQFIEITIEFKKRLIVCGYLNN